eukprot:5525188-Pleurochrysis_carterae.AAC.1
MAGKDKLHPRGDVYGSCATSYATLLGAMALDHRRFASPLEALNAIKARCQPAAASGGDTRRCIAHLARPRTE